MAALKIVKSFGKRKEYEVEHSGTGSNVSWERVKDALGVAVGLSGREYVEGLIADENGIRVVIAYKEGK